MSCFQSSVVSTCTSASSMTDRRDSAVDSSVCWSSVDLPDEELEEVDHIEESAADQGDQGAGSMDPSNATQLVRRY